MQNINSYVYNVLAALAAHYGPKWDDVQERAEEIVKATKTRFATVATGVLNGTIKPAALKSIAEDEVLVLKSQLAEAAIIVGAEAESAANTGIDFVNEAMGKLEELINGLTKKDEE